MSGPRRDLNTTPIVNLATMLVPVTIMTAWFMMHPEPPQPAQAASVQTPQSPMPDVALPPGLSILLASEAGHRLSWRPAEQSDEPAWDVDVPCAPMCEPFDEVNLERALRMIKRQHPQIEDILIVPGPGVSYDAVVRTMTIAQADAEGALFPFAVVSQRGR
jgi:hypothetical protein